MARLGMGGGTAKRPGGARALLVRMFLERSRVKFKSTSERMAEGGKQLVKLGASSRHVRNAARRDKPPFPKARLSRRAAVHVRMCIASSRPEISSLHLPQ